MGEALPGAQHRHTQHKKGGSEECEEQKRARAVNMAHPSAISTPPPPWRVVETPYTGERHARGLAAGVPLARGAVVDVSPVLLFDADTYGAHLRHTALEHYVFVDRGGGAGAASPWPWGRGRCLIIRAAPTATGAWTRAPPPSRSPCRLRAGWRRGRS